MLPIRPVRKDPTSKGCSIEYEVHTTAEDSPRPEVGGLVVRPWGYQLRGLGFKPKKLPFITVGVGAVMTKNNRICYFTKAFRTRRVDCQIGGIEGPLIKGEGGGAGGRGGPRAGGLRRRGARQLSGGRGRLEHLQNGVHIHPLAHEAGVDGRLAVHRRRRGSRRQGRHPPGATRAPSDRRLEDVSTVRGGQRGVGWPRSVS
eukprot:1195812-Prorocentrum_minimum.AAC.3